MHSLVAVRATRPREGGSGPDRTGTGRKTTPMDIEYKDLSISGYTVVMWKVGTTHRPLASPLNHPGENQDGNSGTLFHRSAEVQAGRNGTESDAPSE